MLGEQWHFLPKADTWSAKRGEESAMWTDAVRVCRPPAAGRSLVDLQRRLRLGLGVRGARTCGMQAELNSVISRRISQSKDASEARRVVRFLSTWSYAPAGSLTEFRSPAARSQNQNCRFSNQGHTLHGGRRR